MLLSSILRILGQHNAQPKVIEKTNVEKFEIEAPPVEEKLSRRIKNELEISAAPGLGGSVMPHPARMAPGGQGLEELIRAITKFKESKQSRVVDVFE
jgi:hypothetical protein